MESELSALINCMYFVIAELGVLIGLAVGHALNWWKW